MSAHELHRQVIDQIGKRRDTAVEHLLNVRMTTIEEVAARSIDLNAQVRAYSDAMTIVTAIFREMTEPDKGTEKTVVAAREPIY